jgi:hypothetical protein
MIAAPTAGARPISEAKKNEIRSVDVIYPTGIIGRAPRRVRTRSNVPLASSVSADFWWEGG